MTPSTRSLLAASLSALNGGELAEAARDVPRAVEPGTVRVEVTAPGYTAWQQTLFVRPGATVDVSVELQRSVAANAAGGPGAGPWIVAGVGVASFVAAGVLFAMAGNARDERDALCTAAGCHPDSPALHRDYESRLIGTNIALGLGGALVATGATWWLIARLRGRSERPAAMNVSVGPIAQGWSVAVGGAL